MERFVECPSYCHPERERGIRKSTRPLRSRDSSLTLGMTNGTFLSSHRRHDRVVRRRVLLDVRRARGRLLPDDARAEQSVVIGGRRAVRSAVDFSRSTDAAVETLDLFPDYAAADDRADRL